METTLRQTDVERMIYACRMRQLHAERFGTSRDADIARQSVDRWLDLWWPAVADRAVRV